MREYQSDLAMFQERIEGLEGHIVIDHSSADFLAGRNELPLSAGKRGRHIGHRGLAVGL